MHVNEIPHIDLSDNPTHCCPRFDPAPWDEQELRFVDKPFVRASTRSVFHIPLNMGSVFARTWAAIERAHDAPVQPLVLSHEDSLWHAEHLFAVDHEVPGVEMTRLTGTFLTKVFEGPYSQMRDWHSYMERWVAEKGARLEGLYFFYTTCPRCAKAYGLNYVVGLARVR